jgi:hypothetical protein
MQVSIYMCNTKQARTRWFHVHSCDRESWRHVCMHVHYNVKRLFLESDDVNRFKQKSDGLQRMLLDYSYGSNE